MHVTMGVNVKAAIEGRVSEIRDGCAIVRDGESTQVFSLQWYRVSRVEANKW
ncbi:MAG: hypothetical protein K6T78_15850 [Alicyclobacillus sp.]|nr:hypothetical protein [Alicyclobacillus sp.]